MGRIRTSELFAVLVIVVVAGYADAVATIVGNVFCDQCRDGQRSLFDVPIYGAKVGVECRDSDGQMTMSMQETTDLIGDFIMKVDGTPDMSGCSARVIDSPADSGCNITASPAQPLKLSLKLFSVELYTVGSLFCQPLKPMASLCPNTDPPAITPPHNLPAFPPPLRTPPATAPPRNPHPLPLPHPAPPATTPPTHSSPIISLPPLPFFEDSACSYEYWVKIEYRCYWRLVSPNTKVSFAFGEAAAKKYGRNMTLWEGLQGRGDVYRVLLREATTSLLNSYNSFSFRYNTLSVFLHMNSALQGSLHDALKQALYFKRANLGGGNTKCLLKPCK